ncbi:MAG TPA: DUF4339 domain-containing protein [Dongiaceae bacterium]|nr:DUF4339 domain-containing protein [Dongiaceae bacterium]
MNYFIKRDTAEYGPYSLADLQKYVASGNILTSDLCRSEGLTEWVPVSQVIGNIPVPAAPQPPAPVAGTVYGGAPQGTVYGGPAPAYGTSGTGMTAAPSGTFYPNPPNLHWALVLLFTVLSCGLFAIVWLVVEALWVKKVKPGTKSFTYLMVLIGLYALAIILGFAQGVATASSGHPESTLAVMTPLLNIGYIVMHILTVFAMRSDIEEHFNSAEPIGLSLSGVMTFFFAVFYFQYHFSRINEMKRAQGGLAR